MEVINEAGAAREQEGKGTRKEGISEMWLEPRIGRQECMGGKMAERQLGR